LGVALTVSNYAEDRPLLNLVEQLGIEKFKISKQHIVGTSAPFVGKAMVNAVIVLASSLGIDVVSDSLDDMAQQSGAFAGSKKFDSQREQHNNAMKASEATFYLRCNKRK
jgi:bacillopeptidase F (M6 metalloprotease family)